MFILCILDFRNLITFPILYFFMEFHILIHWSVLDQCNSLSANMCTACDVSQEHSIDFDSGGPAFLCLHALTSRFSVLARTNVRNCRF